MCYLFVSVLVACNTLARASSIMRHGGISEKEFTVIGADGSFAHRDAKGNLLQQGRKTRGGVQDNSQPQGDYQLKVFGTDGTQKWDMTYDSTQYRFVAANGYYLEFADHAEATGFLCHTFTDAINMIQGGTGWSNNGGMHMKSDGQITRRDLSTAFHANEAEWELVAPEGGDTACGPSPAAPATAPTTAPTTSVQYAWGDAGSNCAEGKHIDNAQECADAMNAVAACASRTWSNPFLPVDASRTWYPKGCFVCNSVQANPCGTWGCNLFTSGGGTNNGNFRAICKA
eukprot:gb/GFBE01045352.1/.p1 GENE.gb/GFBE01045352.1/~~gb/GFBE01045352.1/.p1  ORF type:complete len:286 (+),score=35.99 gb/GFBE01045352.1/:1-858(+)